MPLYTILAVKKVSHVNLKRKLFDFEARLLIAWVTNSLREPASQTARLKVKHFYLYVKVTCLKHIVTVDCL